MMRNQYLSVAGSRRLPRPRICLKSTGEEIVFMKTMFRQEGTSTPVVSNSAVVATTGARFSELAKSSNQRRASPPSSEMMGTA